MAQPLSFHPAQRASFPQSANDIETALRAHFIEKRGVIHDLLGSGSDDARLAALAYLFGGPETEDNRPFVAAFKSLQASWLQKAAPGDATRSNDLAERRRIDKFMQCQLLVYLCDLSREQIESLTLDESACLKQDFEAVNRKMQCKVGVMRAFRSTAHDGTFRHLVNGLFHAGLGDSPMEQRLKAAKEEYVASRPREQSSREAEAEFRLEVLGQCPPHLDFDLERAEQEAILDPAVQSLLAELEQVDNAGDVVTLACHLLQIQAHSRGALEHRCDVALAAFLRAGASGDFDQGEVRKQAFRNAACAVLVAKLPQDRQQAYAHAMRIADAAGRKYALHALMTQWRKAAEPVALTPACAPQAMATSSPWPTGSMASSAASMPMPMLAAQMTAAATALTSTGMPPFHPPMPMVPFAAIVATPLMTQPTLTPEQAILLRSGVGIEEQRAEPRWLEVGRRLCAYYALAPIQSATRQNLLTTCGASVRTANVQTLSTLADKDSASKGYQRAARSGKRVASAQELQAIFGWDQDYVTENRRSLNAAFQSAVYMETPFQLANGQVLTLPILSASAPLLSHPGNPQWPLFVDENRRLRTAAYAEALTTIADQIMACLYAAHAPATTAAGTASVTGPTASGSSSSGAAPAPGFRRVVLSAFGMGHALAGLSKKDQAKAQDLAVKEMVELIRQLRSQGVEAVFTDGRANTPFWDAVNKSLKGFLGLGGNGIAWIGAMPGDKLRQGDLLVNPSSAMDFIGDADPRSLNGMCGANSLCTDMHVFHAVCWSVFGRQ